MGMVTIRDYIDADYDDVRHNLVEGGLFHPHWDSRESLQAKILYAPSSILVAEDKGRAVGNVYLVIDLWKSEIFRLAVRYSHRNQGIGQELMKTAEAKLQSLGVRTVGIWVRNTDQGLLTYYGKQNYKPATLTHTSMIKDLGSK